MKKYSFPADYEKKSADFKVKCDGRELDVYSCRISAVPFNQVWPGYQRPFEQTEPASFVMLGSDSMTELEITPSKDFNDVTVRPLSKGIKPVIKDNAVKLVFPGAGQYTVEFDNPHHVLTVFINPENEFNVNKDDTDVLYFGPGVHFVDKKLELQDGQTVFIDEGAVVYGAVTATDKKNVSVIGYGILDNSRMRRANEINGCSILDPNAGEMTGNPVFFNRCENVVVDGITIVDSSGWNLYIDGCSNVLIDNIKLIGMWRYNADGCDFCNCTNAIIKNSFLRTFDDGIVIKGFKLNNHLPLQNILAENCVLWCDWGRALEVGAETSAPYMSGIRFKNCDIITGCHVMLDIQHGDCANMCDVYFEDIRIEYRGKSECPALQEADDAVYSNTDEKFMPQLFAVIAGTTMWSIDEKSGPLKNVYFITIEVTSEDGRIPVSSEFTVSDGEEKIDGVFFENITVNGVKCTKEDLDITITKGVKNVIWN